VSPCSTSGTPSANSAFVDAVSAGTTCAGSGSSPAGVTAAASLQQTPLDLSLAQIVLKDLFPETSGSEITTSLIMSETANYFGLSLDDLCSASRTRQLVQARQIAMYLARELTDMSLPRIGKAFGGRDHTTVMHAERKITALMQERRTIYDQVQELTSRVRSQARSA
jgi:chromosomal replication initiator protein